MYRKRASIAPGGQAPCTIHPQEGVSPVSCTAMKTTRQIRLLAVDPCGHGLRQRRGSPLWSSISRATDPPLSPTVYHVARIKIREKSAGKVASAVAVDVSSVPASGVVSTS